MNPLANDLDHVLAHTTADVWEALRGRQIFVTGGTGFFGRWLLESFAWANSRFRLDARCVVLSRNPTAFLREAAHLGETAGIHWMVGDVRNFTAADVAMQLQDKVKADFPFVIHVATESSVQLNEESPLTIFDTCVLGTRNLLEFATVCGTRRLLFTSSGAVYGPQPPELTHVPEDFGGGPKPLEVGSAYAEGKRAAEHLCTQWHRLHPALEPVIARCFAFAGPHLPLNAHFAVGNFIRDALQGGPVRVTGDGSPFRSYLYAADLAIWLWTMLVRAPPLRAFNVGSDSDISVADLARTVQRVCGQEIHVDIAGSADPQRRASRYVPSVQRAQAELGLVPRISLEEGIRRMIVWHRVRMTVPKPDGGGGQTRTDSRP